MTPISVDSASGPADAEASRQTDVRSRTVTSINATVNRAASQDDYPMIVLLSLVDKRLRSIVDRPNFVCAVVTSKTTSVF